MGAVFVGVTGVVWVVDAGSAVLMQIEILT
jgi:hypothetical protein